MFGMYTNAVNAETQMEIIVFWDLVAIQSVQNWPTFQRRLLPPASGGSALMMEEVSTSETSVNFHESTRRNIAEDSHLFARRRDNLKPDMFFVSVIHQIGLAMQLK
jgi:hypothetical protein